MDQNQLKSLAEKVKNKTATQEEALDFFEALTTMMEEVKNQIKEAVK